MFTAIVLALAGCSEPESLQSEGVVPSAAPKPVDVQLRMEQPPARVQVGHSQKLTVVQVKNGEPAPARGLEWESSDASVLTIDDNGTIEARSAGTAFVSVRGHGGEAMAEITVEP